MYDNEYSEKFEPIPDHIELLAKETVDAAVKVHNKFGPGLLESVYEECLAMELKNRGLNVKTQVAIPIKYEDQRLDNKFKIDLLVEDSLVVEIKAVKELHPVYRAQVLTYLELTGLRLGLLLNFGSVHMSGNMKRLAR